MLESFLSSFTLVAASEMGDKTQLLAFSLAARFRKPVPILGGVLLATVLNHGLASWFGVWIADRMDPRWMGLALGVTFIAFGFWALKPDEHEESDRFTGAGAFLATTILFFLAEIGDKTQFATIALAARYRDVIIVTMGTTLGMMLTNGLAVFVGDRLAHKVQTRAVRLVAAGLFFVFGIYSLYAALQT